MRYFICNRLSDLGHLLRLCVLRTVEYTVKNTLAGIVLPPVEQCEFNCRAPVSCTKATSLSLFNGLLIPSESLFFNTTV